MRNFTKKKLLLFIIRHLVAMETALTVQQGDRGGEGGMVPMALMFRPSAPLPRLYFITHNAPAAAALLTLELNLGLCPKHHIMSATVS